MLLFYSVTASSYLLKCLLQGIEAHLLCRTYKGKIHICEGK